MKWSFSCFKKGYLCLALLGLNVGFAQAQDAPNTDSLSAKTSHSKPYTLATDRPSVSFSAYTAPKNVLIAEMGYFRQVLKDGDATYAFSTSPNLSFRVGLSERVELRLGWDYNRFSYRLRNSQSISQGSGATTLGFKATLFEEKGILPQTAFLGSLQFPQTAVEAFDAGFISPSFRFLFQNNLSNKVALFYNLGANFGVDSGGAPQTSAAYTLGVGTAVVGNLSAFVEVFGTIPEREQAQHGIDAGLTYLFKQQFQTDASFGYGLVGFAPDWFFNVGFSFYLQGKKK
ncbi:transporter [Hugenholtzia roseola]|uniref:transporter n=1 Tax=Hugenholtzia roseola TaxID=1002 RepID=UPI00068684DB|nr:transporter [Hugenholtzia roseola]